MVELSVVPGRELSPLQLLITEYVDFSLLASTVQLNTNVSCPILGSSVTLCSMKPFP